MPKLTKDFPITIVFRARNPMAKTRRASTTHGTWSGGGAAAIAQPGGGGREA